MPATRSSVASRLAIGLVVFLTVALPAPAQDSVAGFAACLDALGERARAEGVDPVTVAAVLGKTIRLERVVELDRSQPEFTRTFYNYYVPRISRQRVEQGRQLYARHRKLLDRLQAEYGVPGHYLVAFWGLETNYGSYFGKISTTDALATLACDPRRSEFFADEFIASLRIIAAGDVEHEKLRGSWAGAIGHVQFLPSTFLRYAIDADGDGRRDMWDSLADAMASAANYLRGIGWQPGLRWGREVRLPKDFDYSLSGLEQKRTLTQWASLGVTDAYGGELAPLEIEAAVLVPAGHLGPAFLAYQNFEVIMQWNRSEYYAITVGRLADRIAGSVALTRKIPTEHEPISIGEVLRLQKNLGELGYDPGKIDGLYGPATRRALSRFQSARGLIADGYLDREAMQAVDTAVSAM